VTTPDTSSEIWNWVRNNGGTTYLRRNGDSYLRGTISAIAEVTAAWGYESRNRALFATAGTSQQLELSSTLPGSGLEYLMAKYQFQHYLHVPLPLLRNVPLRVRTTLGYGMPYGDSDALPPNRQWFVGGPDSVRGFRDSTLGPRDSLGNPYGGNAALHGSAEAVLPMPAKWQTSARASLFFDFGQAFHLGDRVFRNKDGTRADTSFALKRLRRSAGISLEWLVPMGLFRFSYAMPLTWQRDTPVLWGDERERFQFSIGSAF
jgi:outer membrane protein insertion porin family